MPRAPTLVALAIALVGAGAAFGAPSLLVAGVAVFLLVVAMVGWVEAGRFAVLHREPGPVRMVEGERYPLRIGICAPVALPGGELHDPLIAEPVRVGASRRARFAAEVELSGRGRRPLGPARFVVRDPFAIHSRVSEGGRPGTLLVLPKIHPVLQAGRGGGGRSPLVAGAQEGSGARVDPAAIEPEVDGLRPYRPGSPASRIHWPALARTGELHERRIVTGAAGAPLVVLDATGPASAEALDEAVRAAASLTLHLARAGGCVVLVPGARRPVTLDPDLRGWPELHARFALVEAGAATPAMPVRARGALFWVSAAEPAPVGTKARHRGPLYSVTPGRPPGGAAVAFTVGGCAGFRAPASEQRPARAA